MTKVVLVLAMSSISFLAFSQPELIHTWSKALNSEPPYAGSIVAQFVKVDAAGNSFVAGYFSENADFDPGPGRANLTASSNSGLYDLFLAKYDVNGNYIFAIRFGSPDYSETVTGIDLDANGYIYLIGWMKFSFDFDPGPNTEVPQAYGNLTAFIAKYDNIGNYNFAKTFGGGGDHYAQPRAIKVSSGNGNIYITGNYTGGVDFDPGIGTDVIPGFGMFIARYNLNGIYMIAGGVGGTDPSSGATGYGITVDQDEFVYVTGNFNRTVDFYPGNVNTFNLTSVANTADIFIAKYTSTLALWYAEGIGGTGGEVGYGIALDNAGNVVIHGSFTGSCDFDPGIGTAILSTTQPNFSARFIAKYDVGGYYLFAKQFGGDGLGGSLFNSMVLDNFNNILLSGNCTGTVDFDPGPGTAIYVASQQTIFLAKYDANGNYVYSKQMGGNSSNYGYSLALSANNIVLVGSYSYTCDFDPGPGVYNLVGGGGSTSATGSFVGKYNSSGDFINVGSLGNYPSTILHDYGSTAIKSDNSGNVFVVGMFKGSIDADPGPGTTLLSSNGLDDIFISKFDANGNFIFGKRIGGSSYDQVKALFIDGNGNAYLTGMFTNSVDFDPGPGTANLSSCCSGYSDIFIAKYDNNGNYVYAKSMGGSSYEQGNSLIVDNTGNLYVTGIYSGTCDFDPGPGVANLTSVGGGDIFIAKYDAGGNYIYAKSMGAAIMNHPIPLQLMLLVIHL